MDDLNFRYPPDEQQCEEHRLATRIFKGVEEHHEKQCECCGRKIGDVYASKSCCFSNSQLAFLGPGIPLFFAFIQGAIFLLLILTLVFTICALVTNILGGDCNRIQEKSCGANYFDIFSIINKTNEIDYLSAQNYVMVGFIVTYIIGSHITRYKFRKIKIECDEIVDSSSDYAIIIRRMIEGVSENDIREMIEETNGFLSPEDQRKTENLRIIRILIAPNLQSYEDSMQENKRIFKQYIKEDRVSDFVFQPIPQPTQNGYFAIVVFAHQSSKDFFIYKPNIWQKFISEICSPCVPLSYLTVAGSNVAIARAPQPDDIIWINGTATLGNVLCRRVLINSTTIMLLVAGGAAQYGMAVFQNSLTDQTAIFYIGLASSLMIAFMNQIILFFLKFTSDHEKCDTLTGLNRILMKKISFFLFLNAGVFNVAASILADGNGLDLDGDLSDQVTLYMIINAISANLSIFILDYFDLIGKIKRFLYARDCIFTNLSQMEANKLYEKPGIDLAYQYGYIVRTVWLTAFYCPLVPIVVPISILGLFTNYWIQKCLHSRSYRAPNMIWTAVNDSATELFDFIPLIITLGEFLIYFDFEGYDFSRVPDYWSVPIYVSLGLSILILIIPDSVINKKICKIEADDDLEPTYEDIEEDFEVTYEMVHPIAQKNCTKKRKRDKFLLASIFGGARQLTDLSKNTQQIHRTQSHGIKEALIGGLRHQNNQQNVGPENPLNYLAFGGNPSYNPYPNNPNAYY